MWSPGSGINNDTTNFNPFITSNVPTNYLVTITDPSIGCTDTSSVFFNVSDIPLEAGFDIQISSCSDSTTIILLDTSTYSGIINEWEWTLENGFESNQQNAVFIFQSADTLDVQLVVNTNDGCTDTCLLYTSPSPRDQRGSRMPSSA